MPPSDPVLFEGTEDKPVRRFAHVAPEQGIDLAGGSGGLTYGIPDTLDDLAVGDRVMVPLGRGNKLVAGYVIDITEQADRARVKAIQSRDPGATSLPADLIALAKWLASYYCCPLGMVLVTMLPAAVKHGTGSVNVTMVALPESPAPASNEPAKPKHRESKLQAAVIAKLRELAEAGERWVEAKRLADLSGARSVAPVKQLIEQGKVNTKRDLAVHADEFLDAVTPEPMREVRLNEQQSRAIERVGAALGGGFGVHLLHGVTGSGKTEVYLRLIETLLRAGKNALVLVPEIALTPQTVARFLARFDSVAVQHSGLTPAQRNQQWRRIRDGGARIVVGTRSAVFAPLANIGLVIVDEEHDPSYKQDQLPRYHGRDVAIKRSQVLGVPIMLCSATPSLESYYNAVGDAGLAAANEPGGAARTAHAGRPAKHYELHTLSRRAPGLTSPQVVVVDMGEERRKRYEMTGSAGVHLLSLRLEMELRRLLRPAETDPQTTEAAAAPKGQAILLLNRRGYANYIACPDHRCGWMMNCNNCDAMMVYHRQSLPSAATTAGTIDNTRAGFVRCHHCTEEQMLPSACPQCSKKITVFGLGTQRVEEELAKKFPGIRTTRMDSDVMRTARDYKLALDAFRRGDVDVLLGTQMIAKGLDFPGVRLVGVVSADTALNMPDFRAAERTFQLVSQVAGRAGRGEKAGLVVVQTFNPQDAAIQAACNQDYAGFAGRELLTRRAAGLPPFSRMARVVVRDRDPVEASGRASRLVTELQAVNAARHGGVVRVRGPMPCPIARIASFHRVQIELIAPDASALQSLLGSLRQARLLISDAATAVDVDPVALM